MEGMELDYILQFEQEDIDKMFLINKNTDPITAFYELIVVETGNEQKILNGFRPNVSFIVMNKDIYNKEVYKRILPKYAKKTGKFYTTKQNEIAIAMLDLDIGPRTELIVPSNQVWLMKGWLTQKDN